MRRMAHEISDAPESLLAVACETGRRSVLSASPAPSAATSDTAGDPALFSPETRRRRILRFCMLQLVRVWAHLPARARCTRAGETLGRIIHFLVREVFERRQYFATYFLRNRPELQLMCRLLSTKPRGSRVNLTVLACSKGAEVYSIAWAIRNARPDLELHVHAIDIAPEIVGFAEQGTYAYASAAEDGRESRSTSYSSDPVARNTERDQGTSIFERINPAEFEQIFTVTRDQASIRPWLREGISWSCGDAGDPELVRRIGLQDIVVANRFLCHMPAAEAERCLRNIAKLVGPGGHLFVSGVDLNVRASVARSLGWKPVLELVREIHDGDPSIREGWPLNYWALEPFRSDRRDWQFRYASVFEIAEPL